MKDLSKRTAVIVLNWNKPEMTIECLESLQTMEGEYDIFIVDNGSDKDKRQKLIEEVKKRQGGILTEGDLDKFQLDDKDDQLLLLILLDKNYGYAKGNNYGLRLAYKLGYRYSLISNNDVKIIDKNVLVELIKGIESNEKYAWAGPRVIGLDGKFQEPRCRITLAQYSLESGILYPFLRKRGKKRHQECVKNFETSWPVGCFLLLKNKNIKEVDFFDENTFLYAEEIILSEKFLSKNYYFMYVDNIHVLHAHAQTTRDLFKNSTFKEYISIVNSNMYYFNKYRNYSKLACDLAKFSKLFYFIVYRPIVSLLKNKSLKGIGNHNV